VWEWVCESPIDRDRLFRGSFRRLGATATVASPTRRYSSSTSSPPGQVHSTGIYTTDEFVLRCFSPLLSRSSSGGSVLSGRHTDPRPLDPPLVLPFACVKDACVDKVDQLPTWSGWLLLASSPVRRRPSKVAGLRFGVLVRSRSRTVCSILGTRIGIRHEKECKVTVRITALILVRGRWGVFFFFSYTNRNWSLSAIRYSGAPSRPVSRLSFPSWVIPSYFYDGGEICVSISKKWLPESLAGILLISDSSVTGFRFFCLAKAAKWMRWAGESVSGSKILPAFRVRQSQSRSQTDLFDVSEFRLVEFTYVELRTFSEFIIRMREVFNLASHNAVMLILLNILLQIDRVW